MATKTLSRMAMLTSGALIAALTPKLAQDAKLDLTPLVSGITKKNFGEKKSALVDGLKKATEGKLAKDANLDDVTELLDKLEKVDGVDEDPAIQPNSATVNLTGGASGEPEDTEAMDDDLVEKIKAKLAGMVGKTLTEEDVARITESAGAAAALDEDPDGEKDKDKDKKIDKTAMDAALKAHGERIMQQQRDLREAEKVVKPWVGELAIACDSADAVFRAALKHLGVANVDRLHPDALRPVLEAQPKPGKRAAAQALAQDSGDPAGFAERFPAAGRIGHA